MSPAGIIKTFRMHTGADASDTVKVTHAQVDEMVAQVTEDGKTTVEERVLLLEATCSCFRGMYKMRIVASTI